MINKKSFRQNSNKTNSYFVNVNIFLKLFSKNGTKKKNRMFIFYGFLKYAFFKIIRSSK